MIASLEITPQAAIDPDARIELDEDLIAPTAVQRDLFQPDALGVSLLEAADQLDEVSATTLVDELGVEAADGLYARAVVKLRRRPSYRAGDDCKPSYTGRFLSLTRHLGGPAAGISTELEDVATGPIALLATLDERPTVEFDIPENWVSTHSNAQRSRLLRYIRRLTPGVRARITGSRIDLRRLVEQHGDDLPGDVSERARSRLTASPGGADRDPALVAENALAELGAGDRQAGHWRTLEAVATDTSPRLPQADLERDVRFSDVSASAIRRRLGRLEELGLVDRPRFGGRQFVAATAAGQAALSMVQERSPTLLGGRSTGDHGAESEDTARDRNAAVSDPPNRDRGPCYPKTPGSAPAPGRPRGEAETAASAGSTAAPAETRYLTLDEHHRAAAAAPSDGGVALEDRPLEPVTDRRETAWSLDEDRNEVVVSAIASPVQAITAVRLVAALLNEKAEKDVLNPDNLNGGPGKRSLEGLAVSNPYVLRRGATIGWLRNVDAEGGRFLDRLRRARDDLLEDLAELGDDAYKEPDALGDILRRAQGLMGVLIRVYDLLGYDVVRELRVPDISSIKRDELAEMVTRASAISGRYGVYTAFRTLFEARPRKREDALGAPDVDVDDPVGTSTGPWVIVGPGIEQLGDALEDAPDDLDLQEDGDNFAEFVLELDVVDGSRREAYAQLLARQLPFKSLSETREAIGVLRAMTASCYDAAVGLGRLGDGGGRDLDHGDLEYALSSLVDELGADRLLPDVGARTVSKVVATLLETDDAVTTAALAEAAGVSRQSIRDNREVLDELAALGLLDVQEGGAGKAHTWSFSLPGGGNGESGGVELAFGGSTPGFAPCEPDSGTLEWRLSDALFEALCQLPDSYGAPALAGSAAMAAFSGPPGARDVGRLLEAAPEIDRLAQLLATLLDIEEQLPVGRFGGSLTSMVELGARPDRPGRQVGLEAVT